VRLFINLQNYFGSVVEVWCIIAGEGIQEGTILCYLDKFTVSQLITVEY